MILYRPTQEIVPVITTMIELAESAGREVHGANQVDISQFVMITKYRMKR